MDQCPNGLGGALFTGSGDPSSLLLLYVSGVTNNLK